METGCWEDPDTLGQERLCLRDGSLQLPSSSDMIQAPQEHQVLKVFQSIKKKKKKKEKSSLLVLKVRLRESLGKQQQNGPSVICTSIYRYLLFGLVSTKTKYIGISCVVLFGLIQEFNIHFSPPSQHKRIEVGARRES